MYQIFRLSIAAMAAAFVGFPASAPAQTALTQIKLTAKQVEEFIAVQKDISPLLDKMQAAELSDQANARYEAELRAVTRKHGFNDFSEYQAVSTNIFLVMAAIDPETKTFTDPHAAIESEIDQVGTDATVASNEKTQRLDELREALQSAQPIQFPSNIELVRKYYDKLDVTTVAAYEGDSLPATGTIRTLSESSGSTELKLPRVTATAAPN
jgi:hypothetical protein